MTSPRRILIADDNHDVADTLSLVLQCFGHETCVAYDGKRAIDLCQSFIPHVAFLDINMPLIDGYQAARVIRDFLDGQILLVACTGAVGRETGERALANGFDRFVPKPLSAEKLHELLQKAPP